MSNSFGKIFKISTYGESHGLAIGVIIDGCPSGISISSEEIQKELDRRKPGQSKITTQRKEDDKIKIKKAVITNTYQMHLDPHMLTLHMKKNMELEIIEEGAEALPEKQLTG